MISNYDFSTIIIRIYFQTLIYEKQLNFLKEINRHKEWYLTYKSRRLNRKNVFSKKYIIVKFEHWMKILRKLQNIGDDKILFPIFSSLMWTERIYTLVITKVGKKFWELNKVFYTNQESLFSFHSGNNWNSTNSILRNGLLIIPFQ